MKMIWFKFYRVNLGFRSFGVFLGVSGLLSVRFLCVIPVSPVRVCRVLCVCFRLCFSFLCLCQGLSVMSAWIKSTHLSHSFSVSTSVLFWLSLEFGVFSFASPVSLRLICSCHVPMCFHFALHPTVSSLSSSVLGQSMYFRAPSFLVSFQFRFFSLVWFSCFVYVW